MYKNQTTTSKVLIPRMVRALLTITGLYENTTWCRYWFIWSITWALL